MRPSHPALVILALLMGCAHPAVWPRGGLGHPSAIWQVLAALPLDGLPTPSSRRAPEALPFDVPTDWATLPSSTVRWRRIAYRSELLGIAGDLVVRTSGALFRLEDGETDARLSIRMRSRMAVGCGTLLAHDLRGPLRGIDLASANPLFEVDVGVGYVDTRVIVDCVAAVETRGYDDDIRVVRLIDSQSGAVLGQRSGEHAYPRDLGHGTLGVAYPDRVEAVEVASPDHWLSLPADTAFVTEQLAVVVTDDRWAAFDRTTGAQAWSRTFVSDDWSVERIDDDVLLTADGALRRVSLATGADVWSTPGSVDRHHVDAASRRVYASASVGPTFLFALDLDDGHLLWVRVAPHPVLSLDSAGDSLVITSENLVSVVDVARDAPSIRTTRPLQEDVAHALRMLSNERDDRSTAVDDYPATRGDALAWLERTRPLTHQAVLDALETMDDETAVLVLQTDPEPEARERLWARLEASFGAPTEANVRRRTLVANGLRLPITAEQSQRLGDATLAWLDAASTSETVQVAVRASVSAIERTATDPTALLALRARGGLANDVACAGSSLRAQARADVARRMLEAGVERTWISGVDGLCTETDPGTGRIFLSFAEDVTADPRFAVGDPEWDAAPTFEVPVWEGNHSQGSAVHLFVRLVRGVWRVIAAEEGMQWVA